MRAVSGCQDGLFVEDGAAADVLAEVFQADLVWVILSCSWASADDGLTGSDGVEGEEGEDGDEKD